MCTFIFIYKCIVISNLTSFAASKMAFWKFVGLPVVKADDDEEELVDPQAALRVSTSSADIY